MTGNFEYFSSIFVTAICFPNADLFVLSIILGFIAVFKLQEVI